MKKQPVKEVKSEPYDIYYADDLSPLPHLHNNVELIFVKRGSATAHADRNTMQINTGDLFISFPNQVHYYENATRGDYGIYIFAPETFFGKKEIIFDNIPKNNVIHLDSTDDIIKFFSELENCKLGKYQDVITISLINLIFGKSLEKVELKPRLKTENYTLQNILNYCTLNFNSELTLDDAASSLHLSKYYISYLFNNKFGISFNKYINTLRIKYACGLLKNTDKKMSDIAQESGFSSIRSFNRAFTQILEMSPSDFKKGNHSANNIF